MVRPSFFSATHLDRVSHLRGDSAWIESRLQARESRVALVWRSKNLVANDDPPRAVLLTIESDPELIRSAREPVLLGCERDIAYFAVDISHLDEPSAIEFTRESGEFLDLRQVGARLEARDGSLLAFARAMTTWHRRHRHCGVCGSLTTSIQGGHLRLCQSSGCGEEHFPRTDPAVIMLVSSGERCLLGRQASWAPGVFSTLAGFVEPGESLEDAVTREVREETGIEVTTALYHSSQPWPFPSSLMLGFMATALDGSPDVSSDELEEARWFTRDELHALKLRREVRLPPRLSIARRLIDDWLDDGG